MCPCGCGLELDKGLLWILESLERYIRIKLDGYYEIINTSGPRCEKYNKKIGGSVNSAHMLGKAVDIYCPDNHFKWLIKKYLYNTNVKRIGDGVAKSKFIHFDIATGKLKHPKNGLTDYPQEVEWGY